MTGLKTIGINFPEPWLRFQPWTLPHPLPSSVIAYRAANEGETKMKPELTHEEKLAFVARFCPYLDESEALEAYEIYRQYVDEGQLPAIARQYAGICA